MNLSHAITASLLLAIVVQAAPKTIGFKRGSLKRYEEYVKDDFSDDLSGVLLVYSAGRFGGFFKPRWWFTPKSHHIVQFSDITPQMVLECAGTEGEGNCERLTFKPYSAEHLSSVNELGKITLTVQGKEFLITLLYNPKTFKPQNPRWKWTSNHKQHVNIEVIGNPHAGFRLHLKTPSVTFAYKYKRLLNRAGFPANDIMGTLEGRVDFKLPYLGPGEDYALRSETEVSYNGSGNRWTTNITPKPYIIATVKNEDYDLFASLVPVKGGNLKVVPHQESSDSLPVYNGDICQRSSNGWHLHSNYKLEEQDPTPYSGRRTVDYLFDFALKA